MGPNITAPTCGTYKTMLYIPQDILQLLETTNSIQWTEGLCEHTSYCRQTPAV